MEAAWRAQRAHRVQAACQLAQIASFLADNRNVTQGDIAR
jgi:hypothetical protein